MRAPPLDAPKPAPGVGVPGAAGTAVGGKPTGRGDHRTKTRCEDTPVYGETVPIRLESLVTEARFEALQEAFSRRSYGIERPDKPYPNSGATSACGGRLGGIWRADHNRREYRCNRAKWTATGNPRRDCPRHAGRLAGPAGVERDLCAAGRPERLVRRGRGLPGAARRRADRRDRPARQAGPPEHRAGARPGAARQAGAARGLDPELLREAVAELEAELAALVAKRDRLLAIRADEQASQQRAVTIARLAERAATRLPAMDLETQREVLGLFGVRVRVLDGTTEPALRIEGELSGGVRPVRRPHGHSW